MREILFRGKQIDNGEWVYGYYEFYNGGHYINVQTDRVNSGGYPIREFIEVIPETVGQYTGLTDKNGKKIFEGDIVRNGWCFLRGYSVIKFGQYKPLDMSNDYQQGHLGFYLEHIHEVDKKTTRKDIMYFANKCEVIGNIHDNPELLKGGGKI